MVLIQSIYEAGMKGVRYDLLIDELRRYGMRVLRAALRDGRIFTWCGVGSRAPVFATADERRVLHTSPEDRDELALETIANAIVLFHESLADREWNPERSSLHTYFIGACKIAFPGVYRRWSRERASRLEEYGYGHTPEVLGVELRALSPSPEAMAVDTDTLRRILRVGSPEARMICRLILTGYNQAEIAEKLGITTRAVEGHMHRLRKRVEKMVARGTIDAPYTVGRQTASRGLHAAKAAS
ncbi:RNA polymerase sigma factor [Pseudonocardia xishanensis]|uniref:RNA polymerase sigma-70 ECF-like HTH domain-containing protein n=1 Tax=Pseudonocardia xishanensis TaxID=630995 RepID=A0ABP8S0E7_9PSEU